MYKLCYKFFNVIFKLFYDFKVQGQEHLPKEGGVILAPNHSSYLDPPVLGSASPSDKQVFFMAKAELFDIPILKTWMKKVGVFPVKRGASDHHAIKNAVEILKRGGWLGIFPEGTRSKDGNMQEGELGAALIANLAKVPIVPVGMIGTQKYFFTRIRVNFGEPIYLPEGKVSKEELKQLTQKVMAGIAELKKSKPAK